MNNTGLFVITWMVILILFCAGFSCTWYALCLIGRRKQERKTRRIVCGSAARDSFNAGT